MGRIFTHFLVAVACATVTLIATLTADTLYAQTVEPTNTPASTPTTITSGTATSTPRAVEGSPTRAALTPNAAISQSATVTPAQEPLLVPTATTQPSTAATITTTAPVTPSTVADSTVAETDTGPLEGTIIANRTEAIIRFFLEGQTYELAATRSQGINLPRSSTVLNLFNCPGNLEVDTPGCFWDPYLIQQDGFYEIYESPVATSQATLLLREASAPPTGQVWVQNRTDQTESIVFRDEVHEIAPTTVAEFPVSAGVPAILYVRSCLTIDNQSACEWAPKTLDAGVYYAMVEVDTPGSTTGSTLKAIELRPVVGDDNEQVETPEVAPSTQMIMCSVVVPALNVRSGPGLQYDIIGKVRTIDGSAVTVNVTGRSADSQWLTVEPSVAQNGWINNSPSFITCTGDIASLPVTDAPLAPAQSPDAVAQVPEAAVSFAPDVSAVQPEAPATDSTVPSVESASTDTPAADATNTTTSSVESAVPAGHSLLVVNNGFQHEMRFTLDQRFRVQQGPSEFDLQPGASMNIEVFPGDVTFSASSPWSGLSSNATLHVEEDQALTLWLRFQLDSDGTWVFAWD